MRLEFEPPDLDRFPALRLGLEVARVGGTAGAVLNAVNKAKPSTAKGVYLKKLTLSTTMGPGVRVDTTTLPV